MPPRDFFNHLDAWSRHPRGLDLPHELLAFAAPGLYEVDDSHFFLPSWAVGGFRWIDAWELVEIAKENQGRHAIGHIPHAHDPLELHLRELRNFIDNNPASFTWAS